MASMDGGAPPESKLKEMLPGHDWRTTAHLELSEERFAIMQQAVKDLATLVLMKHRRGARISYTTLRSSTAAARLRPKELRLLLARDVNKRLQFVCGMELVVVPSKPTLQETVETGLPEKPSSAPADQVYVLRNMDTDTQLRSWYNQARSQKHGVLSADFTFNRAERTCLYLTLMMMSYSRGFATPAKALQAHMERFGINWSVANSTLHTTSMSQLMDKFCRVGYLRKEKARQGGEESIIFKVGPRAFTEYDLATVFRQRRKLQEIVRPDPQFEDKLKAVVRAYDATLVAFREEVERKAATSQRPHEQQQ